MASISCRSCAALVDWGEARRAGRAATCEGEKQRLVKRKTAMSACAVVRMGSSSSTISREMLTAARREKNSRVECGSGNKKILDEMLRESEA